MALELRFQSVIMAVVDRFKYKCPPRLKDKLQEQTHTNFFRAKVFLSIVENFVSFVTFVTLRIYFSQPSGKPEEWRRLLD